LICDSIAKSAVVIDLTAESLNLDITHHIEATNRLSLFKHVPRVFCHLLGGAYDLVIFIRLLLRSRPHSVDLLHPAPRAARETLHSQCCLVEQLLQRTAIFKTTDHLRHELVGDVKGEAAALDSTVEHMAGVLFAFEANLAVLADASGTTKTERSQSSWPKARGLLLEPLGNVC
jgi:hypothetical protein